MRIPSVAPRRRGPMDEGAGLRNRSMQVRILPSTPTRRSSAERAPLSEGGDRTFESCRRDHAPTLEVTRLDEEPVPNTGRGCTLGRSSRPASATHTCRDGPTVTTPGPQLGDRGSTPRRGAQLHQQRSGKSMPGSRAARRPAVTRKAGVRVSPWQPPHNTALPQPRVVVVQRRGSRHATPGMRVRVPPATPCRRGPEGKGARLVSERERVRSPPPAPIVNSQHHWSTPLRRPAHRSTAALRLPGLEALMAERPVETRQGEVRTLPRPPPDMPRA